MTLPAVAAANALKSKKCGGAQLCATSLSSTSTPTAETAPSTGGGGSSGGGAGSGAPTPPPPSQSVAPSSLFNVIARSRSTRGKEISSGSQMVETLDTGKRLTCSGYTRRDVSWFQFALTSSNPLQITYQITDTIINTTEPGVRFCLGAQYEFTTYSGKPARHARLPNGKRGFVGLLPICDETSTGTVISTGPCVSSLARKKDENSSTGFDVVLTAQIPATTFSDPWGGA